MAAASVKDGHSGGHVRDSSTPGSFEDRGEPVQLLTPDGVRVEHSDFSFTGDDSLLVDFHRDMFMTRRLDREATALQRQGELGLWTPLLGQEAAQIGSGHTVGRHDYVFPSYREHGVAWVIGLPPVDLLGLFRGTAMSGWDPAKYRFHPYTLVIGAQTLHATGYAMAMQMDGLVGHEDPDTSGAVLAYFGDGAISQGDVNESMVFAASYQAPVVFFCQNNQWAISEPIERQSRIPLYRRATGFGIPSVRVDGNDALAVHAVTDWAMRHARSGQGPVMIEAFTYRMGAHTTADDPTKYRLREEEDHWRGRDPIARLETYLRSRDLLTDADLADLEEQGDQLGVDLREGCRTLPEPDLARTFTETYVEQTGELTDQLEEYEAYAASFEGDA
ncbi:pyruvate dehydrogenase (acetyl-transferring) E1 component subunit alpha [Parenemella sanctibonifatiensis]|uniref:Pyruvate dehydrogenase (Acetyl-transferring) E1 component subunit alpha n=1 Tax=Parenemella sanctibonifatiensis TaxID=2016505 RepID=A0A255EHC9_9ACTN|nr:pyruvate dehydrogenase (acetyl-transferring) E1 component subunit alpha [Parenemella sanctibonifatiensis]